MIWKLFKRKPKLPANYKSVIDTQSLEIIQKLQDAGYPAYLVGGCVRDILLNIAPKDFDMATSANPFRVKALIERSQIIGKRFRIVVARRRKLVQGSRQMLFPPLDKSKLFREFQITTFRRAPEKTMSGQLNENVFGSEREDAERRDFTLNGLFLDPFKNKIVDYVGGERDIAHKQLRTIGNPHMRFEEDPIRMLRALRFSLRLNFDFEKNTFRALKEQARFLGSAKRERTREEFLKMAREGYLCPFIDKTQSVGLLKHISPGLDKHLLQHGQDFHKLLKMMDTVVQKYPWPNQHLSAPFFFLLLTQFNDHKHLSWSKELFSLKDDFLISKAEIISLENLHQLFNRVLRNPKSSQKMFFLMRRSIETQAQFFYVLKILAEIWGSPYDKIWAENEDLWKELKQRHFSQRQRNF